MKKVFIQTVCSAVLLLSSATVLAAYLVPNEVTLTHRLLDSSKCQNDSCYFDFYNMTQKYGYGLSLEFGNDWNQDMFSTVMVVDETAQIVDLGAISCAQIPNHYEQSGTYPGPGRGGYPYKEDRKLNPMFWLEYSDAWMKLQHGDSSSEVVAQEGHCYLMRKSNDRQSMIITLHVKQLNEHQSVILNEIEVFQRATITPAN